MELKDQFEAAAIKSKTLKEKPGNEVLLQLYGMYKQATEGDAPEKADFAMFDFVAKAKHDAWLKYAGTLHDKAMQQYIDLINSLF